MYQTALVYLNGWLLTRNVNGYAEETVEAGPYLKYGADNLLKVIADNSLEPNSRWYTGSGIYRPVRLLVGNKVYLPQDTVRITTREADEGFALLDVTAQVQSASTVTERVTLQQTICPGGHGSAHRPAKPSCSNPAKAEPSPSGTAWTARLCGARGSPTSTPAPCRCWRARKNWTGKRPASASVP